MVTNPIHLANRLGEQFIVDQWAKVESSRLRWLEFNQKQIRAELYNSYSDAVRAGDDTVDLQQLGKPTILPASFTGSDRYMCEKYQDAMALCRRFGRPHLFITMTCNPDWVEIKEELKPNQNALNRPDVCARVFKLKFQELMKDITQRHVFGTVAAHVHSIEYQKRGYPHAHILIWFEDKHHLDGENLDRIISAEIPDQYIIDSAGKKVESPLYKRVTKSMIHGPECKSRGLGCCELRGYCKDGFPEEYQSHTTTDIEEGTRFRRRSPEDGGNSFTKYISKKKYEVTNKDVSTYSPWLLNKYDCHINVKHVNSVKSIKYVFKYIMKGSDQAVVTIEKDSAAKKSKSDDTTNVKQPRDEIKEYQTKRYVSSVEACWRLFDFDITGRYPNVEALPVHLPGEQKVYFDQTSTDLEVAEEKLERGQKTKLTEYFRMCRDKIDGAENLYYYEMPEHFTWDTSKRAWKKRKNDVCAIGRMHQAHPSNVERFHLRMLLNHVKGATSFEHLKTLDDEGGTVCTTFLDACIAKHLTRDDQIWYDSMKEAADTMTNMYQLRDFFSTIILLGEVGNPYKLYEEYGDSMNDDFFRRYEEAFKDRAIPQMPNEEYVGTLQLLEPLSPTPMEVEENEQWDIKKIATNSGLCELEMRFQAYGKSVKDFGLPMPDFDRDEFYRDFLSNKKEARIVREKARQFFEENVSKLNQGQKVVFDTIIGRVNQKEGGLIFLDAPGGTGKTFTLNVIAAAIRMKGGKVASTAFSGVAATLLHEGTTTHNMFKIPPKVYSGSTCNVSAQSKLAADLREMDIGFIDEGPMMNKECFECLDRTLRDLTGNNHEMFGGKLILVSGDFRQMLPVVKKGYRAAVVSACLKSSILWSDDITILRLTENMRVQKYIDAYPDDSDFHTELRQFEKWLLDLGDGKLSVSQDRNGIVEIPKTMARESREEVMECIFGDLEHNFENKEYLKSRLILAADNAIVNETNIDMVQELPGELHSFKSIDTVDDDDARLQYPVEYLNMLNPSGFSEHELHLKVGAPVILLRNFDVKAGHCNGTRYIVKEIRKYSLELEKLDTNGDENDILQLPRICMNKEFDDMPLTMKRLQFPIKLAFAVTFHRSQGQSVEHCGILLPKDIWTHGQIYVAFSRCGNPHNIHVWAEQEQFKNMNFEPTKRMVKNVVYPEVLGSKNIC